MTVMPTALARQQAREATMLQSYARAERLKKKIEAFWAERGLYPKVRIERPTEQAFYLIRSDMVNGRPV
jgi:hypothetical protein